MLEEDFSDSIPPNRGAKEWFTDNNTSVTRVDKKVSEAFMDTKYYFSIQTEIHNKKQTNVVYYNNKLTYYWNLG